MLFCTFYAVVMAQTDNFEGNVHLVFDGSNNFEGILQARSSKTVNRCASKDTLNITVNECPLFERV